jgi:hypothetical protein
LQRLSDVKLNAEINVMQGKAAVLAYCKRQLRLSVEMTALTKYLNYTASNVRMTIDNNELERIRKERGSRFQAD